MMRQLWNRRRPMRQDSRSIKALWCVFFLLLLKKTWVDEGSLWHVVWAELRRQWGTASIHSSLEGTLPFLNGGLDRNGMQRSCSDDSVTPACIWRVNAGPRYSRTSTHWDGKNSLPIAFRRAWGPRDAMCVVCLCMYVRGCARISSGPINSRARQRGMWGHAQSPPFWSCGGGADVPSQALCLALPQTHNHGRV